LRGRRLGRLRSRRRDEEERDRVHAVTRVSGRESFTREDVPQVAVALCASNLFTHAVPVRVMTNGAGQFLIETGPTALGVELVVRPIQGRAASLAGVRSGPGVVLVLPGEWGFGPLVHDDPLFGAGQLSPFGMFAFSHTIEKATWVLRSGEARTGRTRESRQFHDEELVDSRSNGLVRSDAPGPFGVPRRRGDQVELTGRPKFTPLIQEGVEVLVGERLGDRKLVGRVEQSIERDPILVVVVARVNLLQILWGRTGLSPVLAEATHPVRVLFWRSDRECGRVHGPESVRRLFSLFEPRDHALTDPLG
jgi:hypothetical protein